LLVSIIVLSCSIIHSQEIIINGYVEGDVAGNGSGDNGKTPFDKNPNNNTITIEKAGSVEGNVYGARNDKKPEDYATSNTAVIKSTGNITGNAYGGYSSGTGKTIYKKRGNIKSNLKMIH
jgi:hypothetical protein